VNTLKTLCTVIVLSAVGYGVYATLYGKPDGDPPPEVTPGWDTAPQVQMPQMSNTSPATMGQGGAAPKFVPAAPSGEGNPFPSALEPPRYPSAEANSAASTSPAFVPSSVSLPANNSPAYPQTQSAADSVYNRTGTQGDGTQMASLQVPANSSPAAGTASAEFAMSWQSSLSMLQQGKLDEGLVALSKWYDDPRLSPTEQQELNGLLDRVAGTVIYSRQHLLEPPYQAQPGDTLDRIAEAYQVPWQLLAKINGIQNPQQLRPGEQLKVFRGPFDAVINLGRFEMTLYLQGRYAGRFRIGTGRDHSTPPGEFAVKDKVKNPAYYAPDGKMVPANDPQNPLGGYWIDLGNQIGIHGTNDPQSIGRDESRGCIRLAARDIEDVFDILSKGSRVFIRP
jgi:LysM repeat protein